MKFAVASTEYFREVGFNPDSWRKSVDGSLSMCHAELALTLADETMVDVYSHNSPDFNELLDSPEWNETQDELDEEPEQPK